MLTQEFSHTARIAAKIRALRRSKEYSQEYMALMLHISQNAYSRLENGKTPLTVDRLFDICNILSANAVALIEREEPSAMVIKKSWQEGTY
ncbi:MAG: helix-turn-helix transcriptional regulator [Chitinophagaceae bacterium]